METSELARIASEESRRSLLIHVYDGQLMNLDRIIVEEYAPASAQHV